MIISVKHSFSFRFLLPLSGASLFFPLLLAMVPAELSAQEKSTLPNNAYYSDKVGQYHSLHGKKGAEEKQSLPDGTEMFQDGKRVFDEEKGLYEGDEEVSEKLKALRSFLRLVDGGMTTLEGGESVKVVGVDIPGFREGEHYRSTILRAHEWFELFLNDPESAMRSFDVEHKSIKHTDSEGKTFTYFYIFFPREILDDIRKSKIQAYEPDNQNEEKQQVENKREWKATGERPAQENRNATGQGQKDEPLYLSGGKKTESSGDRASFTGFDEPVQGIDYERKEVERVVISTARYYHVDGSLKREETYKDKRLIRRVEYDTSGNVVYAIDY